MTSGIAQALRKTGDAAASGVPLSRHSSRAASSERTQHTRQLSGERNRSKVNPLGLARRGPAARVPFT
jgi:hypothetical protein